MKSDVEKLILFCWEGNRMRHEEMQVVNTK